MRAHLFFAHGAGAGPDSEFMQTIGRLCAAKGHAVHWITFPYWQIIEDTGKKRPPDRAELLDSFFIQEIRKHHLEPREPLFLMGKSMGARVAFRTADRLNVSGVIGLGFPFHPPGRAHVQRLHEVLNNTRPALIVQGERDPFGNFDWFMEQQETLSQCDGLNIQWITQGNHDLVPPKRTGLSAHETWTQTAELINQFIKNQGPRA